MNAPQNFASALGDIIVDEALSRLGLTSDPFDDVVIDDLFFTGAGRGALLDELVHQVRYGEDLCLVSGDVGIGKTRLWHHLQHLAPADTVCVAMQAQLFLSPEQFVAQCLGGDEDVLPDDEFVQHLQQVAEHKRQHWLLIDDAQELHDSLYKKLAQWTSQFKGTLRVVLFADATLKYRLQNPALGFALSCWALQPLSPAEVAEYLMCRLQYFGWQSEELPFSAEELDQICRHSEGVPLNIHDVAIAVLQKSDDVGVPQWRMLLRWPYLHVGLLLLAVSTLTVVWFGGGDVANGVPESPQQDLARVPGDVVRPLAEKAPAEIVSQTQVAPAPAGGGAGGPAVIEFRNTMQPATTQGMSTSGASAPPQTDGAVASSVAPPPIEGDQPGAAANAAQVRVHPQADTAVVEKKPAAIQQPAIPGPQSAAPVTARSPAPTVAEKPVPAPNLQQKPQKPAVAAAPKAPPATKSAGTSPLAGMSPQHYVVQLIATTDPARMASFRSSLPSGLQLASYQRITSGQRWHVLVYGDFPSIAQARAAINRLPALAKEQKPWAKPVAQVHKEMTTVRQ